MFEEYDHIVAFDYAESNTAIARLTKRGKEPTVKEGKFQIADLRLYLEQLTGTVVLVIEETTTSQYLYCELLASVDRILICDPHRNRLLNEGAKTDKIDAQKLALLARGGLLREVFHTTDGLIDLRKLASAYQDVVVAVVRLKNQKSALYRQAGCSYQKGGELTEPNAAFVLRLLDRNIVSHEELKAEYEAEFGQRRRKDKRLRDLAEVPGIATIGAVKILSRVVDARRFKSSGKYLAYCGLVWEVVRSGKHIHRRRRPRYCRLLKSVYKTAALAAIGGKNDLNDYYQFLRERGVTEQNARHAVARQVAIATYGMLKHGTRYRPYLWRENIEKQRTAAAER